MGELIPRTHRVDPPNHRELDRAAYLSSELAKAVRVAKANSLSRVTLDFETAEELCQLLHDSLKTANQLGAYQTR